MEYLCIIVDRANGKTLAEYEIQANQMPMARHKAANIFRQANPGTDVDWYVDSLQLE